MDPLYKLDIKGKIRVWTVSLGHISPNSKQVYKNVSFSPDASGSIVIVSTYGTLGGKEQYSLKVITTGKQGRTVEEQAMSVMLSMHNHKIDRMGYVDTVPTRLQHSPMLAKNFRTLYLNKGKELAFDEHEYVVQPKLDGERVTINVIDGIVTATGRRGTVFSNITHVYKNILSMKLGPTVHLDGELMITGTMFQDIHSIINSSDKSKTKHIQVMVFDMFDTARPHLITDERLNILEHKIKKRMRNVKLVETISVDTFEEIKNIHDQFVDEGFEGIMIRQLDSTYLYGRSQSLLKWKYQDESDYIIVSAGAAKTGRERGAIIWRAVTKHGDEFNVRPKGSIGNRREMYKMYKKNKELYDGKVLQVYHEGTSKSGIPRNPRSGLHPKVD